MHKHCIFITSTLSFQIALGSGLCFLFFLGFFGAGDLSAATTITRRWQTVNVMDARRVTNEQASPAIPGLLYDAGTNIKLKTHSKKLKGVSREGNTATKEEVYLNF